MSLVVPHCVLSARSAALHFTAARDVGTRRAYVVMGSDEYLFVERAIVQGSAGTWRPKKDEWLAIRNGAGCLFSASCVIF